MTAEIELVAYSDDCRLRGRVTLDDDRLTDMLNAQAEFVVRDVLLESLEDGRTVELREMLLLRDELLLVEMAGPRGERTRRLSTRQHRMQVKVGPFVVAGYLHAPPTIDAYASVRRRPPMVPLTAATISYSVAGLPQLRDCSAVILNREQAEWIMPTSDEALYFPNVPTIVDPLGMAKDLSGSIFFPG